MDSQITRSRQRILESAVSLLRQDGLSGQLVASSAAAADVPASNASLFFQNDGELILAIYLRLAGDLQAHASALPAGGVADRFRALLTFKLNLVKPYREAFAGLFAKILDPRAGIGVLSQHTELVRLRTRAAFAQVVHGADDAPDNKSELIHGLYAAHLALLLICSQESACQQ
jgi:AcrR family transcriptional regulator